MTTQNEAAAADSITDEAAVSQEDIYASQDYSQPGTYEENGDAIYSWDGEGNTTLLGALPENVEIIRQFAEQFGLVSVADNGVDVVLSGNPPEVFQRVQRNVMEYAITGDITGEGVDPAAALAALFGGADDDLFSSTPVDEDEDGFATL